MKPSACAFRPPRRLYCAMTLGSAVAMCYVPYLFGTTAERKLDFSRMYAGTR